MSSNLHPEKEGVKVRHSSSQPSIFVRTFILFTSIFAEKAKCVCL